MLNQGTVSVSNGYTLNRADDVPKISTNAAGWSVSGATTTYNTENITAGYVVSGDGKTGSYNDKVLNGETLIISGIKNNLTAQNGAINGVTISENLVTIEPKIIGASGAMVSDSGYF